MIRTLIWILLITLVSPDLTHIFKENVTAVTVPRTPKKYNEEIENLTCNDILHLQNLIRENVTSVPRTQEEYNEETKDLKCNHPMLKITYVLNPDSYKTSIGCFCEKPVPGKYCLESNIDKGATIIQPKYNAPCNDLSITPCKVKYFSSESYKLFECFEKYGGISSPIENQRKINSLKQRELSLNTENQELKKKMDQREIYFTNVIEKQNETIKQRDDEIQNLQDENDGLKSYKVFAIFSIVVFLLLLIVSLIVFIYWYFRNRKSKRKAIPKSQPAINPGTTPHTDSGDQEALSFMKYDDQQKEEHSDGDQFTLDNPVVEISVPHSVDQADDMVEIQVGEPLEDLKMNKRRDKKSVEYPV